MKYIKSSIKPFLNNLNDSTINPQISLLNKAFPQDADTNNIRENIVTFNIFYNDLSYNQISDTAAISWYNLLASISGILGGSFLGISLLSILEFFEYIVFSIYVTIVYFFKNLKLNQKLTSTFVDTNVSFQTFNSNRRDAVVEIDLTN